MVPRNMRISAGLSMRRERRYRGIRAARSLGETSSLGIRKNFPNDGVVD
jgi:hypothetical protein